MTPEAERAELHRRFKEAWRNHKFLMTIHIIWRLPLYACWFVEAVVESMSEELRR